MGALVGALYATGKSPAELRLLAASDAFAGVFTLQTPYTDSSYRRRQDRRELSQAITVGLRHGPALRNALLSDRGVNAFLTANMPSYNREELDYDLFPIPFRCVATDLNTLSSITFAHGPLPQSVLASISIPGVFPPVLDRRGHYLVDGGILDNLPTDVLKRELHAGVIVAVHLEDSPIGGSDTSSIVGVLNRAFSAGIASNVEQAQRLADVVVHVPVGSFSSTDYTKASALINAGYKAAEASRAALLPYALDETGWQAYLAARQSRGRQQPGPLRQVRVEGGVPAAQREVQADLKPIEGQPITPAPTTAALKRIQSYGVYAATWETFAPQPDAEAAADGGLLVHLSQNPTGPPYLLISPEFAAATSNVSRGEFALRLVDQDLGGFGSELRATARLGYMTDLSVEYYRQLTPGGFFLEPSIGLLRAPVYLWSNQKRVAERFQQNLDAGLEAGRTFSSHVQLSTEWRTQDTRWSLTTGAGGGPYLYGTSQRGLLHIDIDEATAGTVSPSGFRISAAAGSLYHTTASDNAPLVQLAFSATHSWQGSILGISGESSSYLRARVAQPFRFTLGGPGRLSAASFDEYRGTDDYLARAGYMHRIAALPTGLGQGLYLILGYEAGEVWSPESRAFLRQDGTTGVLASTPLGVITIGGAVGDAGHRKVFVTLGRIF
jgi:NTE family protein